MKKNRVVICILPALVIVLCLSGLSAKAQTADISGTWVLNVKTDQGKGKPRFVLKQQNDSITGTYTGDFGEAPVAGKVKGTNFDFRYTIRNVTVSYLGTYSGNKMQGKSIYGTLGEGSFTGKRKKK